MFICIYPDTCIHIVVHAYLYRNIYLLCVFVFVSIVFDLGGSDWLSVELLKRFQCQWMIIWLLDGWMDGWMQGTRWSWRWRIRTKRQHSGMDVYRRKKLICQETVLRGGIIQQISCCINDSTCIHNVNTLTWSHQRLFQRKGLIMQHVNQSHITGICWRNQYIVPHGSSCMVH